MKKKRKILAGVVAGCMILAALTAVIVWDRLSVRTTMDISVEEADALVRETVRSLPLQVAGTSVEMVDRLSIRVDDISHGDEKDIILHCTYETVDVLSVYDRKKEAVFTEVYGFYLERTAAGVMVSASHILYNMSQQMLALVEEAEHVRGTIDIYLYDTGSDRLTLWLDDETVDTLLGGMLSVRNDVNDTTTVQWEGEEVSIKNNNSLRRGVADCFGLNNYSSEKPDVSSPLLRAWNSFTSDFYKNFIEKNRWIYLAKGLGTTLAITGLSLLLGVFIGFLTAIIRVTHDKQGRFSLLNGIGKLYVTIIRGTPVMIQLMIIYFVLLLPIGIEKFPAAVLCFGLNSGAYVSEIIRGGIMSVDGGQMEAGRSLGFGYVPTMCYIILPQAFKAVLPALCNEFIALLKETSVAFYIGVADLTMGGLKIRSITYSNFMPLIAIALIYLVLVLILTRLVGILEKKLRKSER